MNATTDLLYPSLNDLPRTFHSRGYRMEIEKLSIERLESYIELLTDTSIERDVNRNEKLRICLRFRNAYMIQLPFFSITKYAEEENPVTQKIYKFRTVFYPEVSIVHHHARSSYLNLRMLLIHTCNMIKYFNKWGWIFDKERKIINKKTMEQFNL